MENGNPFHVGQMVVCISDEWTLFGNNHKHQCDPKLGLTYTVSDSYLDMVELKECFFAYEYKAFAPIQDATNLEFSDAEIDQEIETIQHQETAKPCPYIL